MVMSVWYLSYNLYCTGFAQTDKALYAVRGGVFGVSGDFFAEFFSASTSTMNDEISNVDATAFAENGFNELIVNKPFLEDYVRRNYPKFPLISSTVKQIEDYDQLMEEFKKDYKLAIKRGLQIELLETVIETLAMGNALPPENRDHDLTGNWRGHRECHIQPDWLLIYRIEGDVLVLTLSRTGTHSDLFGK